MKALRWGAESTAGEHSLSSRAVSGQGHWAGQIQANQGPGGKANAFRLVKVGNEDGQLSIGHGDGTGGKAVVLGTDGNGWLEGAGGGF